MMSSSGAPPGPSRQTSRRLAPAGISGSARVREGARSGGPIRQAGGGGDGLGRVAEDVYIEQGIYKLRDLLRMRGITAAR